MTNLREEDYTGWMHDPIHHPNHVEDLHSKLEPKYNYGPGHTSLLSEYTLHSQDINDYLWKNHKNKSHYNQAMETHTGKLDDAIHANKAPHDFHVFTGMQSDPRDHMNSEGIVHHPAYLSTSLDPFIASNFAKRVNIKSEGNIHSVHYDKHIMRIRVPQGHPGAYVENLTQNPREFEHILPSGLNLKHVGTDTIHEGSNKYKSHIHIHHMEIVK